MQFLQAILADLETTARNMVLGYFSKPLTQLANAAAWAANTAG
jgi:hypothetical protein